MSNELRAVTAFVGTTIGGELINPVGAAHPRVFINQ
jgi:hypothetical protein